MRNKSSGHNPAVCVGVVLIFIGALFLLVNFTNFSIGFGTWWPAILIVAGLLDLLFNRRRWFRGAGTLIIGALFFMDTLDVWDVPWQFLWPVPILIVGLSIILGATRGRPRRATALGGGATDAGRADAGPGATDAGPGATDAGPGAAEPATDAADAAGGIDVNATFGERRQAVSGENFPGGRINAVFGSAQVDLAQASLANGEATINASAVFGSVVIRVPADWAVDLRAGATMGEVADKRPNPAPESPKATLTVTGSVTFGSIEIRP